MSKNHPKRSFDNRPKQGAERGSREKTSGGNLWIYGKHAALAALANKNRKISRILVTDAIEKEIGDVLDRKNLSAEKVDNKRLAEILPEGAVHQGIALLAVSLSETDIHEIFSSDLPAKKAVILDQVTDPHNVGAILRSAAAFGADAVIVPKDNSPPETTVLAKAASGALEIVPLIKVTNLVAAIKYLKDSGFWVLGLDGAAKTSLDKAPDYDKVALVLGAEGAGLRRLTAENCDLLVKLPISDKMESLNVSNAAAVALYELAK